MSFDKDLIKEVYESDIDNLLYDFYVPSLAQCKKYDRLAGFFSSQSLSIAARGISGLIKNDGKMRLVACPQLNKKDIDTIKKVNTNPDKYLEKILLNNIINIENEFIRDHVYALGWMLANNKLEIKIAVPKNRNYENIDNLFHIKVGIMEDTEGNVLSFSGSLNESAKGWISGVKGNTEEFKVFKSWVSSDINKLKADINKFNRFWNDISPTIDVFDLPEAIKQNLIEKAPKNKEDINLGKWYRSMKKDVSLFNHQKEAIRHWVENNFNGLLVMATGTGKTYTALGCLDYIIGKYNNSFTIITCPTKHLINQWLKDINNYRITYDKLIKISSDNKNWKNELTDLLIESQMGYFNNVIIITTHDTFSSNSFTEIIKSKNISLDILLIADEAHGLGAQKRRNGLLTFYKYRLGLTATPERFFDDEGTSLLLKYFNGVVYEFGLDKALKEINPLTGESYLTPYTYIPKFIELNFEELEDYKIKTQEIVSKISLVKNEEDQKFIELLLFLRANIIKNAKGKYLVLNNIIKNEVKPLKWTIINCSPTQIDNVMDILKTNKIIRHRFTMEESSKKRDQLIRDFASGKYQVLVSMECLDEGVDVPPARYSLLMANSTNSREYIQRIGRVLRRFPGKKESLLFDFIVVPSTEKLPKELKEIEWKIFNKEIQRYEYIAKYSQNNVEVTKLLLDKINTLRGSYGKGSY